MADVTYAKLSIEQIYELHTKLLGDIFHVCMPIPDFDYSDDKMDNKLASQLEVQLVPVNEKLGRIVLTRSNTILVTSILHHGPVATQLHHALQAPFLRVAWAQVTYTTAN